MKNPIYITFIASLLLTGCSCTEENLEIKGKVLTVGFQSYRAAGKNPVEALRYE